MHVRACLAGAVVLVLVLAGCMKKDDEPDPPPKPIGNASLELAEGDQTATFVAKDLTVSVSERCQGFDVKPVSEETCKSTLAVTAKDGDRSLQIEHPATSGDAIVAFVRPGPIGYEVRLTNASDRWSSAGTQNQLGALVAEVAADGTLTLRLDRVALSDTAKTKRLEVSGTVVIDCKPGQAGSAKCNDMSGPARP